MFPYADIMPQAGRLWKPILCETAILILKFFCGFRGEMGGVGQALRASRMIGKTSFRLGGTPRPTRPRLPLSPPESQNDASLGLSAGDTRPGIDQRFEQVGAAAFNLVSAQIYRNEVGLPAAPTTVLVPGVWCEGDLP